MGRSESERKNFYRTGHRPWNKGSKLRKTVNSGGILPHSVRLSPDLHRKVCSVGQPGVQPSETVTSQPYRLLRPRKEEVDYTVNKVEDERYFKTHFLTLLFQQVE